MLSLVGQRQRVLELGCSTGRRARALQAQDCRVVGIDIAAEAVKQAAEHCEHVVVGDLDGVDLDLALGDRRFDVVVAGGVLAQLASPEAALSRVRPFLAAGGYLVATVPNVAHGRVRLALLGGSFPHGDGGPLARSALRFYTRASLVEMLEAAGYRVADIATVEVGLDEAEAPAALGPAGAAFVEALRAQPDATAYQFVALAYPERTAGIVVAPAPQETVVGSLSPPARDVFDERQLLYLDLLKRVLARDGFPQRQAPAALPAGGVDSQVRADIATWLDAHGLAVVHKEPPTEWPVDAETMLGPERLDNVMHCVGTVVRDGVPGDLIETGVWRGGACILMRGVLEALGDRSRTVWVADSFQGLPKPDAERYPADEGDLFWTVDVLAVSLAEVMANFRRYHLLDDQVRFLPGWFEDTLPTAPIERLAVLRLDGDMYASTMQALEALYPKLSPGGFAIIDDYGAVPGCRAAVHDFRTAHDITEPMTQTDYTEVFWRKGG